MKIFVKFLFIFCIFIAGCAINSFDITQPLVRIEPEPTNVNSESIMWDEYNIESIPDDQCVIVYLKLELGCGECYISDRAFSDQMAITLINQYFIPFKIDEHTPNMSDIIDEYLIKEIPTLLIIKKEKLRWKYLHRYNGPFSSSELIGMLFESIEEC